MSDLQYAHIAEQDKRIAELERHLSAKDEEIERLERTCQEYADLRKEHEREIASLRKALHKALSYVPPTAAIEIEQALKTSEDSK